MIDKDITVWFSCGAASAVATYFTLKKYGSTNRVRIVNNPVKEEHEDNLRFLSDVETWLGIKVEFAVNSKFPDCSAKTVWSQHKYMSGIAGAPCTMRLKKHARQEWESKNNSDYLVLGFTSDEKKRSDRFKMTERNNLLPVLVDENITKQDCFNILATNNISLPKIYSINRPTRTVLFISPTIFYLTKTLRPFVYIINLLSKFFLKNKFCLELINRPIFFFQNSLSNNDLKNLYNLYNIL